MPFIKSPCPICGKTAESVREFSIAGKTVSKLQCGHLMERAQLEQRSPESIVSMDGKRLYPFQCEGVRFLERASARALVADEMSLGKTVQALGTIALHNELLPFLAIVKSSLKDQWQHETMRWLGEDHMAQIIRGTGDFWLPGMSGYIISYDLLRRFISVEKDEYGKKITNSTVIEIIHRLGIKTVILDECQQIKNVESQRTVFTRAICKEVEHVIALSGTPIKNHAGEYFPVLNIVKPEMFPNHSKFLMYECDSYQSGFGYKTGGLRDPKGFMEKTKGFIIRRTRKEVLPDLPKIQRTYSFHELSKAVEAAYLDTFRQFRDDYNSGNGSRDFAEEGNILAYISKMRYFTGLSKIDPCVDFVREVMEDTEDRIAIFVHHIDVAEFLIQKLNKVMDELGLPHCARHSAGSSSLDTERSFEKTRCCVLSTLAGGEGLNLQKLCYRFVMLEREWNPANEEQAESRFPRPEGLQVESILGTYFIATGTVDEFFTEIVEKKREIVGKTLDGKAVEWNQSSLMKELAEVLAVSGGKRWSI